MEMKLTTTFKDGVTAKEIGARRLTSGADGQASKCVETHTRTHASPAERVNLHSQACQQL